MVSAKAVTRTTAQGRFLTSEIGTPDSRLGPRSDRIERRLETENANINMEFAYVGILSAPAYSVATRTRTHVRLEGQVVILAEEQRQLLTLCAIPKLNWNLVAREAQEPGGLPRLLKGEAGEDTERARAAAGLIREALAEPAEVEDRVESELRTVGDDVRITTVLDDNYPANLRVIFNLPPFLLYRGVLSARDARSVAVVGTRKATDEGLSRAREIAAGLVEQRVVVLSGLARGIDTAAHEATVAAGGRAVAVLGTGINAVYPRENEALAEKIVASGGAVVSQFWPTAPPRASNFPIRNIVTSGMSQGTVVVEASGNSGARNQARRAIEHGKWVFLVSGLVTSEPWAQSYLERPDRRRRTREVESVDEIAALLWEPEAIEALSSQRRQLVLDLA